MSRFLRVDLFIIRLEARLQSNIGFTLRCVLAVFTRSAITPPKVDRFGWNPEHSGPGRFRARSVHVATAWELGESLFLLSVGQHTISPISRIFIIFGRDRNFKFGRYVDHSKCKPKDDKLSLKRRYQVTWPTSNFDAPMISIEWMVKLCTQVDCMKFQPTVTNCA